MTLILDIAFCIKNAGIHLSRMNIDTAVMGV